MMDWFRRRLASWLAGAGPDPSPDRGPAAEPIPSDDETALRALVASQGPRGREVEALVDGLRKLDPKTRAQVMAVAQGRLNKRSQIVRRWEAETNHWYQTHEERPS